MEQARKRIDDNREQAIAFGAVYKFVLHGDGGGTFIVNLGEDPGVSEGDGTAQCTIKMAAKDFLDVIEGRADRRALFFMGRLRVEGDFGLAMKLKALHELTRAEAAGPAA
jgi:putative sterol carrier protein